MLFPRLLKDYRTGRGAGESRDPIVLEASAEDSGEQAGKKISVGAVTGIAIGIVAVIALTIGAITPIFHCLMSFRRFGING
jgi:hypothetical protein